MYSIRLTATNVNMAEDLNLICSKKTPKDSQSMQESVNWTGAKMKDGKTKGVQTGPEVI